MTQGDEADNRDAPLLAQQLAAIGGKVHDVRESHGWSHQALADRAGIARPSLSLIEAGKQNITLDTLWRLADALDVHWADLLDDRKTTLPQRRRQSSPFDQQLAAFGGKLYQTRVLQHLYQQTLTDRTRIGRTAISEMEDGKRNITLSTLSRIAAALEVHWADLLDDRKRNPPQPARPRKGRPV